MSQNTNGREAGLENVKAFHEWAEERDCANDWSDYFHRGQLNRSEIARECAFALSCFRSNPALGEALRELEKRLRDAGNLPSSEPNETAPGTPDSGSQAKADSRILRAKCLAEQRIKMLEEQNASLRAEVVNLRDQLKRLEHLDEHLCKTGRLLHS